MERIVKSRLGPLAFRSFGFVDHDMGDKQGGMFRFYSTPVDAWLLDGYCY